MNNRKFKIVSALIVLALVVERASAAVGVMENKKPEAVQAPKVISQNSSQAGNTEKDETVYVLAGADGSTQKIIVSDWVKNALESNTIPDRSDLQEIENVKGDESYSLGAENMKIWDAEGNDIYYRGNAEKELPVDLALSYTLDGKSVSADEIAGKSGRVSIRFDYKNNQYETVEIDGKDTTINVPFTMLTGLILDSDCFRNVSVTNGKLMNDGNRTVVVGIAFPGLQDNLALDRDKLEIPDYVEVTADVTGFKLGMTVTIATNEMFSALDTSKISSFEGLSDSMDQLTDAMSQLIDGSSSLYDGLCTLLDKSTELVDGVDELAQGAKKLKNGALELDDGADRLATGIEQLSNGLNTLSTNNDDLINGSAQVFDTLLSTAEKQIAASGVQIPHLTIENYAEVLKEVISSLDQSSVYDSALQAVTQAVEANRAVIAQGVTEAVKENVIEETTTAAQEEVVLQVTAAARDNIAVQVIPAVTGGSMTKEAYEQAVNEGTIDSETEAAVEAAIDEQMEKTEMQDRIAGIVNAKMASAEVKDKIAAVVAEQLQGEEVQAIIADKTEEAIAQLIEENMGSPEVQEKLAAATEGAKALISLKASLDSYNAFYLGLNDYTKGVATAAAGASKLKGGVYSLNEGTTKLRSGAVSLYGGIIQIQDGTPKLTEGITKLRDGSLELSDGLKKFDEEGVQKLLDAVDEDLSGLGERLKATADASKKYRNFSGISDEMDGKIKFIYKTDEIA